MNAETQRRSTPLPLEVTNDDCHDPLMTPVDVTEFLSIKMSHFRQLVFEKKLKPIRIGRLLRIPRSELMRFIDSCK